MLKRIMPTEYRFSTEVYDNEDDLFVDVYVGAPLGSIGQTRVPAGRTGRAVRHARSQSG